MHLDIEGIPVLFPFDYVYPEQLAYMRELKYSIENRGTIYLFRNNILHNTNLIYFNDCNN